MLAGRPVEAVGRNGRPAVSNAAASVCRLRTHELVRSAGVDDSHRSDFRLIPPRGGVSRWKRRARWLVRESSQSLERTDLIRAVDVRVRHGAVRAGSRGVAHALLNDASMTTLEKKQAW